MLPAVRLACYLGLCLAIAGAAAWGSLVFASRLEHQQQREALGKGLEVIFDIAPSIPDNLVGDPLRVGQVFINYANNAVKFTEHGEICVQVRMLEASDEDVLLRFEVQDTSIGLSPEQMGRLFQHCGQADASTTRKYGGTGLGAYSARLLARAMHGELELDASAPGETTVLARLPLAAA